MMTNTNRTAEKEIGDLKFIFSYEEVGGAADTGGVTTIVCDHIKFGYVWESILPRPLEPEDKSGQVIGQKLLYTIMLSYIEGKLNPLVRIEFGSVACISLNSRTWRLISIPITIFVTSQLDPTHVTTYTITLEPNEEITELDINNRKIMNMEAEIAEMREKISALTQRPAPSATPAGCTEARVLELIQAMRIECGSSFATKTLAYTKAEAHTLFAEAKTTYTKTESDGLYEK